MIKVELLKARPFERGGKGGRGRARTGTTVIHSANEADALRDIALRRDGANEAGDPFVEARLYRDEETRWFRSIMGEELAALGVEKQP